MKQWTNTGLFCMFQGGVNDRPGFYRAINSFHLELFQISDAAFDCHGRNRFPFNRIFAVVSAGKTLSRLTSHSSGQSVPMKPGAVCFISAGADLEFEFRKDTHFFAFHFNLNEGAREVFTGSDFLAVRENKADVIRRFRTLLGRRKPDTAELWELKSLLLREITSFLPRNRPPFSEGSGWDEVFRYIRERADAATGIADLARIRGLSPDRFSRLFSRTFHMTAKKYLETELARKAGHMLLYGEDGIKEIAAQLRFSDEFYFSRFFRKQTGLPPGRFRKCGRSV